MKFSIFLLLILPFTLVAGPIYDSFKKTEKQIYSMGDESAQKKMQLKNTLFKSLKSALVKFYNYQNYKDITPTDITYEEAKETKNAYYVKYKDFFAYFTYRQDPSLYYIAPFEQKVVVNPTVDVPRFSLVVEDWENDEKEKGSQKIRKSQNSNKEIQ